MTPRSVFSGIVLLIIAMTSAGATIRVPDDVATIQAAINVASDDDEIVIAPGVYGDFNTGGKAISVRAGGPLRSVWVGEVTINSGEGRDTLLEGLGFRELDTAIFIGNAQPTIRGCRFLRNGTAIRIGSGSDTALIEHCRFEGDGQGIDSSTIQIHVRDCVFDGLRGPALDIDDFTFAFFAPFPQGRIERCVIRDSSASLRSRSTSAFPFVNSLHLVGCLVEDNDFGIEHLSGQLNLVGCRVEGNGTPGVFTQSSMCISSTQLTENVDPVFEFALGFGAGINVFQIGSARSGTRSTSGVEIYGSVIDRNLPLDIAADPFDSGACEGLFAFQFFETYVGFSGNFLCNPSTLAGPIGLIGDRARPGADNPGLAGVAPDVADLDGDGNTSEPTPFDPAGFPRLVNGRNDAAPMNTLWSVWNGPDGADFGGSNWTPAPPGSFETPFLGDAVVALSDARTTAGLVVDGGVVLRTTADGAALDATGFGIGAMSQSVVAGDLVIETIAEAPGPILLGDLVFQSGTLAIGEGSTVEVLGNVRFESLDRLDIDGTFGAELLTTSPEARITGGGAFEGVLELDGTLQVDDRFTIDGSLVCTEDARTALDLQTLPTDAPLAVTGDAVLAGTLVVSVPEDFVAVVGESVPLIEVGQNSIGTFGGADFTGLAGVLFEVEYAAGMRTEPEVRLRVRELDGDVLFDPAATVGSVGIPTDAQLADLNGDAFVDLIITIRNLDDPETGEGSVLIFYNAGNAGDGSWLGFDNVAAVQVLGVGINPDAVAIGDLNGDAIPDLVVANRGVIGDPGADTVTVLINEPMLDGTFAVDQEVTLDGADGIGDEPRDVILVDLDEDDRLDIVVANAGSDSISILYNLGSSVLLAPSWLGVEEDENESPLELPPDACPFSIRPGEFDANFTDLVVANTGRDSITIIRNNGDRSYAALPERSVGSEPIQVRVGDLNGDGADDIVTANRGSTSLSTFRNLNTDQIALTSGPTIEFEASNSPLQAVTLGDFDGGGDGNLEVLALVDDVVRVLRNDTSAGAPTIVLTRLEDESAVADPVLLISGDLNLDERDDYVTIGASPLGARTDETIGAFLGIATPEPCSGDIDGDGVVDLADFATLSRNFGRTELPHGEAESREVGDLDDDGDVDMEDFQILAQGFGCRP
jgi:hypothetical protein